MKAFWGILSALSLIACTMLFGGLFFMANNFRTVLVLLMFLPGLIWGCWLAGNYAKDAIKEEFYEEAD